MDSYSIIFRLSRFALGLIKHTSGGLGVFAFCLSFHTPFAALHALLFLSLATAIEFTAPKAAA